MKNDLLELHKRAQEIVCMLSEGIPLSLYDAEMEVLNTLADELLSSMDSQEIKKGLMNMYFLGKLYAEQKNIVVPNPYTGSNNLNIEENDK